MAVISALNAIPPRPPGGAPRARLFEPEEPDSRVGAIMSVPDQLLAAAVGQACAAGMAIMFSPSADGGCVGVHIWKGHQKDKRYVTSAESMVKTLESVRDIAEAHMAGFLHASSKVLR